MTSAPEKKHVATATEDPVASAAEELQTTASVFGELGSDTRQVPLMANDGNGNSQRSLGSGNTGDTLRSESTRIEHIKLKAVAAWNVNIFVVPLHCKCIYWST